MSEIFCIVGARIQIVRGQHGIPPPVSNLQEPAPGDDILDALGLLSDEESDRWTDELEDAFEEIKHEATPQCTLDLKTVLGELSDREVPRHPTQSMPTLRDLVR